MIKRPTACISLWLLIAAVAVAAQAPPYPKLTPGLEYIEDRIGGCTDALNLDGGGSATMWLGGKIMNSPSEGKERAVANGLIVVRTADEAPPAGGMNDDKGRN